MMVYDIPSELYSTCDITSELYPRSVYPFQQTIDQKAPGITGQGHIVVHI